jgi:glycosyltransferase involved in cell wall biosynthesis
MLHIAIDARVPEGVAGGVAQVIVGMAQGFADYSHVRRTWVVYPGHERWLDQWIPAGDEVVEKVGFVERVGMKVARRAPTLVSKARPLIERALGTSGEGARTYWDGILRELGVDVALLPFQDGFATSLPTVYHPHDFQHRYLPGLFSSAQIHHREHDWRARAEHAAAISVGTEAVKRDVEEFWGIPGDRVYVVPLAPITFPSTQAPLPKDRRPLVLYPAAFWPHKDHVTLIRAIGTLRREGVDVQLVLPGAHIGEFKAVRSAVEEAELPLNETTPGFVTSPELRHLYERAWLIAVPSLFESASFPVWEGFRHSKPAVVARTTSLPSQVGEGGLVVEQKDVEGFADAIGRLISDDALAARMGAAGKRLVDALSWRRTALATVALCRIAAGDTPREEESAALLAE